MGIRQVIYIDTAAHDGMGNLVPELGIHVDVTTPTAIDTTGRLGYLRVRVAAPAPSPTDPSSSFSGDFAVDLMSNSSRSRLMANDVSLNRIDINQALVPSLTATTNVHLGLTTDFFQADFPEIKARLADAKKETADLRRRVKAAERRARS